jgi:hypothetical protein
VLLAYLAVSLMPALWDSLPNLVDGYLAYFGGLGVISAVGIGGLALVWARSVGERRALRARRW